jgi:hypothetical protein
MTGRDKPPAVFYLSPRDLGRSRLKAFNRRDRKEKPLSSQRKHARIGDIGFAEDQRPTADDRCLLNPAAIL